LAFIIPVTILFLGDLANLWHWEEDEFLLSALLLIFIAPIISYILKPFVVKED